MQNEARLDVPGVTEHERKQPYDAGRARLTVCYFRPMTTRICIRGT